MPKDTFNKLDEEKKTKILAGILEEFVETKIEDATVSGLCTRASIHRSAFYRYFEDLDDAFLTLMQGIGDRAKEVRDDIYNIYEDDMFVLYLELLKTELDLIDKYGQLMHNIFKSSYAKKMEGLKRGDRFKKKFDNIVESLLSDCINAISFKYIHKQTTKEEAIKLYTEYIVIIRKGSME